MHIAYSSLRQPSKNRSSQKEKLHKPQSSKLSNTELRYQGYQAACSKYQKEIDTIRQYLPGWRPKFESR